jgi:23S rRNA pseudouridine1911/1915/1917 synthase
MVGPISQEDGPSQEGGGSQAGSAQPAETHEITAEAADAGGRLDRLLAAALPRLSRSRLQALIAEGCVSTGGTAITTASQKVKAGQKFSLIVPETRPVALEGQAIPLEIRHEDADLIVLEKPAGLVVHPAAGNPDKTLVNALIAHCGSGLKGGLTGIGGEARPGIVHRLDKDTSGLMVAAKSEAAHHGLVEQFAARTIERAYWALVWGLPQPAEGAITGNIGRSPRNRKKMAVLARGGRPAVTRYRVREVLADGRASLVECRLLTGRTHQIRVHLSARGHPVIGDPLYGRSPARRLAGLPATAQRLLQDLDRQALHAEVLGFIHPTTGESVKFLSQLPEKITQLKSCLEEL